VRKVVLVISRAVSNKGNLGSKTISHSPKIKTLLTLGDSVLVQISLKLVVKMISSPSLNMDHLTALLFWSRLEIYFLDWEKKRVLDGEWGPYAYPWDRGKKT
jgi:hypothetical protein